MSDWISWNEAVGLVARHFPLGNAEGVLRAAIHREGVITVRASDQGLVTKTPHNGRYFVDNPEYPYRLDEPRACFRIEDIDLRSLKVWLAALTGRVAAMPSVADQPETFESVESQATPSGPPNHQITYRSGVPGRPTSAHLIGPEMQRRATERQLAESLSKEAEYLCVWLSKTHPSAAPMSKKTIQNAFRKIYRDAQNQGPK